MSVKLRLARAGRKGKPFRIRLAERRFTYGRSAPEENYLSLDL